MNTPDKIPSDPEFIFLKKGEIIKEGDQFWFTFDKKWIDARATVGLDVDAESVGHYRRYK